MKTSPATARILVATDNADDARLVVHQLGSVFGNVRASTAPGAALADFEEWRPQALVLAFDTLEKSERYYLSLYRHADGAIDVDHRTVVLCGREEVAAAFELCRQGQFDDYVLFWPQSFDGTRLAMSVWVACRQTLPPRDGRQQRAPLSAPHLPLPPGDAVQAKALVPPEAGRDRPAFAPLARRTGAAPPFARPLVLAIEDDAFARDLVQQALDPSKWQVVFATDGAGALIELARSEPAIILMDVRLPDIDGVVLTRRLRSSAGTAHIPILMLTGDSRRETLLGSIDAGAEGFVVKPVSRATLEAKLEKILSR